MELTLVRAGIVVIALVVAFIGAKFYGRTIPVVDCDKCDADYCGGCKAHKKVWGK